MTRRRLGRILGLVMFLGVISVVGYGLMSRGSSAPSNGSASPPTLDAPPTANTTELPTDGGTVQDLLALAEDAAWTRMDPETGELRYKMEWDHMEPREQGLFLIDSPRAWMIDDQRIVIVTSAVANVIWPARDREPESGQLEGEVIVHIFDESWEGAENSLSPPPGIVPTLTFTTASLQFNSTFGEVATDDAFRIEGPGIEASGEGLTLRFSTDRGMPITFLRIDRLVKAELREEDEPTKRQGEGDRDREGSSGSREGGRADAGSAAPAQAFYHARLEGGVRVLAGGQTLRSETADIWARLEDGRLPEGAVATWESNDSAPSSDEHDGEGAGVPHQSGAAPSRTMVLRTEGSLELRLLEDPPGALAQDDLLIRFQSPRDQVVRLTDAQTKSTIDCMSLEYGATRRNLTLFGIGPVGVTVVVPNLVEITAGRLELNLTTGEGAISTPGSALALGDAAAIDDPAFDTGDRPRELRWSEQAIFKLDTSSGPVGSGGRVIPREITFTGRVEARDGLALVKGDSIEAKFRDNALDPGAAGEVTLTSLTVVGRAEAQEPMGGRVLAEKIDVIFEPDAESGRPRPVLATAQGDVRATRDEQTLRAGLVKVEFAPGRPDQNIVVDGLEARLGVEITLVEQPPSAEPGRPMLAPAHIVVLGDRVRVEDEGEQIEILGEPARITRTFGDEVSEIEGTMLRIANAQSASRRLSVLGPGTASHQFRRPTRDAYGQVELTFAQGFSYDDEELTGEARGDVVATAQFGADERHVARGQTIKIELRHNEAMERELATAIVDGAGPAGAPAEMELRRYQGEPDAQGARPLEAMAFLRGQTIGIDAATGLLHVPTPGLLLLEDRRVGGDEMGDADSPQLRGTTLFEWAGEFRLNRSQGVGTITEQARMRHRDLDGTLMTEIECERMRVEFDWPEESETDQRVSVLGADASGAVYARRGTIQLICDILRYDDASGIMKAYALEGNRITVLDEEQSRHVYADAIELDMKTGAWGRVSRPTGVLIPR